MTAPLGTKVGSAFFDVVASFSGFGDSLQSGVTNAITSRGLILGNAMENLGKKLFTRFTIPFGVAAAANIAQFQGLERAIAETLTLFGTAPALVDETFEAMSKGISTVSREIGGLERDIADGLYQTISAGVPGGQAFEFIEVAQIAAIADKTSDLTTAVDGITTGIRSYGLEFSDAEKVSDQFFATVARGKTTFGELSQSLGRVSPLAANAGASLGETLAIVGQLTVQGIQTSEAMSFLRAAITGLLRPSDEMTDIFRNIGFASAEAAVPVIGLQGAFQAVVDAAGGSTAKLQELIGTSEGVTAILGVTGKNAESFASILGSVENSAGRASAAFDIVDATFSRSFGRMTEAFDRLGNLFGSIGADFAKPVVEAVTAVLNEVYDVFQALAPLLVSVAGGFAKVVGVFKLPVIKQLTAAFAALVLTFGGLLGILGALVGPIGFLISKLIGLKIIQAVLRGIWPLMIRLSGAATSLGGALVGAGAAIEGTGSAAKTASKSLTFFGKTMQISSRTLIGFGAGFVALTAATVAALAIAKEWRESLEQIDRQTLITAQGVDRLAVSLGAVIDPLETIQQAAEGGGDVNFQFQLANADLLQNVQNTLFTLGEAAAEKQIISIAYQLDARGATTADIDNFINRINEVTGLRLDLPTVLGDISTGAAQLFGVETALAKLGGELKNVNELAEGDTGNTLQGLFDSLTPSIRKVQNEVTDLATQLVQLRLEEGPQAFADAMQLARDSIGGTDKEDFFVDQLLIEFDKAADGAARFSTNSATSIDDFYDQFRAGLPFIGDMVGGFEAIEEAADRVALKDLTGAGGLVSDIEEYGIQVSTKIPGIIKLTEAQSQSLIDLRNDISGVLTAGTDFIQAHFDEMNTQVMNQMPLLGVYAGAVKQSFGEWKKGQISFRKDIENVTELRARLVDEFSGDRSSLLEAFDSAPLSEQAWLAQLSPKNLESALEQLKLSQDAGIAAVSARMEQDTEEITAGVYAAMDAAYQDLYAQAAEAGDGVADLWLINFERQSSQWVVSAAAVMGQISAVLSGEIPGPTVGGINYGPSTFGKGQQGYQDYGLRQGNITINTYNPVQQSISGDTSRALGIARTHQLYNGGGHRP